MDFDLAEVLAAAREWEESRAARRRAWIHDLAEEMEREFERRSAGE
jgi:hypothetical protein